MASLFQSRRANWVRWMSGLAVLAATTLVQAVPAGSAEEIRERTKPVGQLCRAGQGCGGISAPTVVMAQEPPSAETGAMTGEQVYGQSCFACHASGVSGAPKFADAEAWAGRVAKGMDALMVSTINGINLMPPRGTCMACSDEDLRAAVKYMVESAR